MEKGRILDSGNHDELLEKSNEYKNFYEKQIQK
jgi:ABC-type multidrug transport system fused ATPase/permease subunit